VLAAFADAADALWLPEITTARAVPAAQAISFHFVDYLVHSWDVARALELPLDVPDELAGPALEIAALVPTDPARRGPGAAFGPAVAPRPGAPAFDRLLATLGRDPGR